MEDNKEKGTEQQTLTVEEQLATLQKEKADIETQLEEKTKGLKTAHATLKQKDDELKRRGDIEGKVASLDDQIKFFTAFMAESAGKTEGEFEEAKAKRPQDLLKRFEAMQKQSESKRQRDTQLSEVKRKSEDLQSRVEAIGLTENDEGYLEIQSLVIDGFYNPAKMKLAELRVEKLEKAKAATKESPKETEPEMKERLEREIMLKHGLLKPESSKPSAGGKLTAEIVTKMSPQERWERREEISKMPLE